LDYFNKKICLNLRKKLDERVPIFSREIKDPDFFGNFSRAIYGEQVTPLDNIPHPDYDFDNEDTGILRQS
jgi:hypothetical protein